MKVINYQEVMIDLFGKGLGNLLSVSVLFGDVGWFEWNLFVEDVSLLVVVFYEDCVEYNLNWMQVFVQKYGVKFVLYGKMMMVL